jgi:hypothetical protein
MTPSYKNDILHAVDSIARILSDLETIVDIVDNPFAEITMSDGLLMVSRERKT